MKIIAIIEVLFVLELTAVVGEPPSNSSLLEPPASEFQLSTSTPFKFDSPVSKLKSPFQKGMRSSKKSS